MVKQLLKHLKKAMRGQSKKEFKTSISAEKFVVIKESQFSVPENKENKKSRKKMFF